MRVGAAEAAIATSAERDARIRLSMKAPRLIPHPAALRRVHFLPLAGEGNHDTDGVGT